MGINCLKSIMNVCVFLHEAKLGLIMRIDVSGYLCAGFDLEELGPYRLSDWQEGFIGVADPLGPPDGQQRQKSDHRQPDRDAAQDGSHCCRNVARVGLRDVCEGDDRANGCSLVSRPGEQGREDYANSRGRYVF